MSALLDYDTGPLNWVRGDIDTALQAALGRIQAYSVDADLTNALRLARDDAHQVTGALRMVGLEGAATLAGTLESCLADVNENRLQADDEMLRAMRNALEGLQRWVKDLADGRGSGELALFPLYKRLRELQGAERVFEGELFFPDLRSRVKGKTAHDSLTQEELAAKVKAARGLFQRGLLSFLRNVDAEQGLHRMRDALASIERIAPSQASQTFWWACVGFVDSLIARGVEADFHVKQLLARVDLQMRRLMEGSPQVAERLLRDALFFVAKSQTLEGRAAEVRTTFGLDRYMPGRGLLDPEALARMRPLLAALQAGLKAARDSWHAYVEGHADQLAQFQDHVMQLQPQAQMLENSGLVPLLNELVAAAGAVGSLEGEPREQMNLEVAATLLFMQNAIDREDVLQSDFAERAGSQQARLRALIEGRELPASTVEPASQREAERDMLVHMAQEVGQNLKQMEEALDAFFRDADEREALAGLPALAQQAQGALTMLELPQAASLLKAAIDEVQPFLSEGHPDAAGQQRLADAFSSLGLYVESYCSGRADAVNILRPILVDFGLIEEEPAEEEEYGHSVESGMPARKAEVKDAYLGWRDQPDEGAKKKFIEVLTELSRDAELVDDDLLKQQTQAALEASREPAEAPRELDDAIEALSGLPLPARAVAAPAVTAEAVAPRPVEPDSSMSIIRLPEAAEEGPAVEVGVPEFCELPELAHPAAETGTASSAIADSAVAEMPPASNDDGQAEDTLLAVIPEGVEPELLEIFLEEANEVLATMGEATTACQGNPDDQDALTVIRRAFHTLKGSGRMVGLSDLGETSWRFEQLMNGWLNEKKAASNDLLILIGRAKSVFQDWVAALQSAQPLALRVPVLLAGADRVAQGQALDVEVVPAPAAEEIPAFAAAEMTATLSETAEEAAGATEPDAVVEAPVVEAPVVDVEADAMSAFAQAAEEEAVGEGEEPAVEAGSGAAPQAADAAAVVVAVQEDMLPVEPAVEGDASGHAEIEMSAVDAAQSDEALLPEFASRDYSVPATPLPAVGAIIEYAVPCAASLGEDEAPGEPESVAGAQPASDEVCVGPVCLSAGLFDIFMAEAYQRLAVLLEESDRLAEIADGVVSEHARRAVHTLAGIAGTAGIAALADLSHALELYWNRFVNIPLPGAHLALVGETISRLQGMVTSIEGRELPDPANDLIATLGELGDEQTAAAVEMPGESTETVAKAETGTIDAEPPLDAASESEPAEAPAAPEIVPLDVSALVPDVKPVTAAPVFERREVTDEIDQQLLPIFLEESESLVPDASVQLRAWKTAPDDVSARDALRRTLHTIKGSARMVGAMRLGELTHVMESRVIAVIEGQLEATPEVFETLEAQADRLADAVERLKQGDLSPVPDEAPLAAPVEPIPAPVTGSVQAETPTATDAPMHAIPVTRDSNALTLRVRADWVDRMVNQAGEVAIARSRIESEMFSFKRHVSELSDALARLRGHIREVEIQAESQMQATFQSQGVAEEFDPLEFDRFTRFQEVTRFLAESVNDISTVQHILLARLGEADAALVHQTRLNRELQQNLLRVRMVPLYSVAERLYRTVRQTARDVNKRAQLDIHGGDLEIDRSVLEKVTAPIEHLLRNALAHGIESPEQRRAAGKAEFGEIVLSARQSGNEMVLTVQDDGAGLNFARIREKAEANGLLLPGTEPTETLLAQMIFAAGFTTAETVSQVAGRGVGMDVVKSEISALGGRIDITSKQGAGTCFSIYLPLTLAMTQAVMVQAAKHDYALPATLVQQVLELNPADLEKAMAAGEVTWRGGRYPFFYLPHLLGDTEAVHEVQRYNPVLLLQSGTSQTAVLVDLIEGSREIVVKNIGPQMARITGVAGATVRGDGRVILILNPVPLALRWSSQPHTAMERPAESVEVSAALQPPMVLVVDDSLTVRKITTRLLSREGFRVDSAKDGVDALEKMNDLLPDIVLLDVEMPRMDGFELARVMRSDPRLKSVPIIMITSRTADKHRNRAMEIGVNVYLGKPYQEQQLLDHIAEQLGQEAAIPA